MKPQTLTRYSVMAICFFIVLSASAEETWTIYTEQDGLISNVVRAIAVDYDNVKWFGTAEYHGEPSGVSRFDGTTWKSYTTEDGIADSLVFAITVDHHNIKWFGTRSGVSSFDGATWHSYTIDDRPVYNTVTCCAVDANNMKWFGSIDRIASYDDTSWTAYTTAGDRDIHDILSVAVDHDNVKWFGSYQGVYSFDGSEWQYYSSVNEDIKLLAVYGIAVDRDNVKWAIFQASNNIYGFNYGIASFQSGIWTPYVMAFAQGDWPSHYSICVAVDENNSKWLGTMGRGLYRFDDGSWTNYTEDDGLIPHNYIYCIAVDADNVKWIGTSQGVTSYDDGIPVSVSDNPVVPTSVAINGNYPNPFNPATVIEFILDANLSVCLDIYDVTGQQVKTLTNEFLPAGEHSIVWDGTDNIGSAVASGVYFCRLQAGKKQAVHRMVLIR